MDNHLLMKSQGPCLRVLKFVVVITWQYWGKSKASPSLDKRLSRLGWQAPSFASQAFLRHSCPPRGLETAQIKMVASSRIEGLSTVRKSHSLWSQSSLNFFFLQFFSCKTVTTILCITSMTLPAMVDFCWPLWMQHHSTRHLSTVTILTSPFPSTSQALSRKKENEKKGGVGGSFSLQKAFVTCNS